MLVPWPTYAQDDGDFTQSCWRGHDETADTESSGMVDCQAARTHVTLVQMAAALLVSV